MHTAFSAASRSFCLSRQVGASITDDSGNVLAIGYNDVPKANGGLYSFEDSADKRCFNVGNRCCTNTVNKNQEFVNIKNNIVAKAKIEDEKKGVILNILKNSPFKDSIEHCRAIHAEMEALLALSRNPSRSTVGTSMYVTLQSCHNCTKHILGAGVKKVIFIEPYPKSLAQRLHSDAIEIDPINPDNPPNDKLVFIPYEGIAPLRYQEFFMRKNQIKDKAGKFLTQLHVSSKNGSPYIDVMPRSRLEKSIYPTTILELNAILDLKTLTAKSTKKRRRKGEVKRKEFKAR